jgi:hypothetical protein
VNSLDCYSYRLIGTLTTFLQNQEFIVRDSTLLHLLSFFYYHLSMSFTRLMCEIRSYLNRGFSTVTPPRKWEPCHTNIQKSNNHRMIQRLTSHTQQTIKDTSTEDLDPRPLTNNDHSSKSLGFLTHNECRTSDNLFPLAL